MRTLLLLLSALALLLPSTVHAQEWHTGLCQAKVDASLSFPVGGVIARM